MPLAALYPAAAGRVQGDIVQRAARNPLSRGRASFDGSMKLYRMRGQPARDGMMAG